MDMDDWRARIDEVDVKILELLNERASYTLAIGKIKHRANLPVYQPEREKLIYERLERSNRGPLTNAAVRRLFERIIDESRRLEHEIGEKAESSKANER
jgi:chorismate mutase